MKLFFNPRPHRRRSHIPGPALPSALLISTLFIASQLTGCKFDPLQPGPTLQGHVLGGQQPVNGATIFLYAAGSSGPGTGAVNLLAPNLVTTDASGSFAITGDYLCPTPTTQVYLVALGGNPGLASGDTNPALALMTALGNCGALTSSSSIVIDEVTTVASVYALSQFLAPGAIVGSSPTNATGLASAFALVDNLVNPATGLAPGAALPASAVTEPAKLNTLANVLSSCVNSDGGAACTPLFAAATASGPVPTNTPANTIDAALNIVRNPGANVSAVLNAAPPQGPFQPALINPPSDWTLSITYGICASACGGLNLPGSVAIDSSGNAWVANYFGGGVSKFSPTGVPASPNGLAGEGLQQSYGIAIDPSGNAWVTNQQSVSTFGHNPFGSVSEFSSAGVDISADGYTSGGIYYPQAAAADSNGAIWIADYGNSSATLLTTSGSTVSATNYASSALPFASAVAIDASHNAWFAVQGAAARVTPSGAVATYPCCTAPAAIAIDPSGNIWLADYSASSVVQLTPSGAVAHRTLLSDGNANPQAIAIDGAGNAWVADYFGNSLAELTASTAALASPTLGFGLDAPLSEPYGLAIDASGNLWLSNSGANTLTQFVGLAAPIKTPLLGPPVQP
jgi:streptogramin lyase